MDKDAYIRHLEARIVELEKRIEELERLLGMNSKNSSKPPSSDSAASPTALPRRRHKNRRARKGHHPGQRFDGRDRPGALRSGEEDVEVEKTSSRWDIAMADFSKPNKAGAGPRGTPS